VLYPGELARDSALTSGESDVRRRWGADRPLKETRRNASRAFPTARDGGSPIGNVLPTLINFGTHEPGPTREVNTGDRSDR
jgi:hypothetical protein